MSGNVEAAYAAWEEKEAKGEPEAPEPKAWTDAEIRERVNAHFQREYESTEGLKEALRKGVEITKRESKLRFAPFTLQESVEQWIRTTFGEEAYLNLPLRMRKLWEEVSELFGAYAEGDQKITPEFEAELADCYICLLALASVAGKSLDGLAKAKLQTLGERIYEQRPDGTWQRVKD